MYEHLLQLDTADICFNRLESRIVALFLAFVMYGVALGMKSSFFKSIFYKPQSLILGLVCQWVLLPLFTFVTVSIAKVYITPMVAMGLILVASCPGGAVSNFMVAHSKGNTELSVTLTTISTLAAPIFTPLNFAIWGGLYVKYISGTASSMLQTIDLPIMQLFASVVFIIGIPVALGLLTNRYFPKISDRIKSYMRYLSILCFVLIVVMMLLENYSMFREYIRYIFVVVLLHNLLAILVGYLAATLKRSSIKDRRAITLEVSIQNSALGLLLLFNPNIFPQEVANGGMIFVVAWWGVWHIISGLLLSTLFRFLNIDMAQKSKRRV